MSQLPSGTVTFLFTDIEGSTKIAQQFPDALPSALALHHRILQHAIDSNRGTVFNIVGDAFCAAFDTAPDALGAALAAQRTLQTAKWGDAVIKVRMGLHTGEAEARDGEYHGYLTLSRVQRLMSAARGGQVLVSSVSEELLRDRLPVGIGLRDLGNVQLKDFPRPERVFQVVAPDLPSAFLPLASLSANRNNLPLQLTSFVGRTKELEQIKQLLAGIERGRLETVRLLTLIGPGGTGKTRLSLQVASDLLEQFADGVWFVELAPLADPALVPATIAAVLDVRLEASRPVLVVLADVLRAKRLLLILDNCEHVLDACAQVADALLRACPNVQLLASSREALGIAGESAYRLPSLPVPGSEFRIPAGESARTGAGEGTASAALLQYDAVRLFVDRAVAARADFQVTNANAVAIAQICYRLDGIPLAIELAAARVKALRVEQIAARLDDRFRLLTGGSRTALPRQQTLRALIDWSYDLLSEPERVLLARLSVFAGGWTLEAAEEVAKDEEGRMQDEAILPSAPFVPHQTGLILQSSDVLDLLTHLVDKSLVVMDDSAADVSGGETRYHFLETIRQFARDKLLDSRDGERVRMQHLRYFDALSSRAEEALRSVAARDWQSRLYADQDNFRAATEWGLACEPEAALRIAGNLMFFWSERGRMTEGLTWLQQAMTHVEKLPAARAAQLAMGLRARGFCAIAHLNLMLGDNRGARAAADESIGLYQALGDKDGLGFVLCVRGISSMFIGEPQEGIANLQQGIAFLREAGDMWGAAAQLPVLAHFVVRLQGDADTARRYLEEALRYQRAQGDSARLPITLLNLSVILRIQKEYEQSRAVALESLQLCVSQANRRYANVVRSNLAELARLQGQFAESEELYRSVIVDWREYGQHGGIARCLELFALMAIAQGRFAGAARLLAAAAAIRVQGHADMAPDERSEFDQAVQTIRAQLAPHLFDVAWAAGSALNEEGAVALAIQPVPGGA